MIKKVLHLRSSNDLLGAENVIIELCKYSYNFGYQTVIGALKNEDEPFPNFLNLADEYQIETFVFNGKGKIDFTCVQKIRRFVRENKVDILHCHGYKENFYALMMPIRLPKIATNHLWKKSTINTKIYALMDSFILRFFNKVIGVSDEIVKEMRQYGIRKAISIPNGVDIDRFTITPKSFELFHKFRLNPDSLVIGMVSSLTPEKGHKFAVNALKDIIKYFPETKLLIVGDGNQKISLQNQVAQLGLEKVVIFTGRQSNISEIYSIIDIFLLPSLKEGLPMALLEAMASGKAVVASSVGENTNVITHGKTGILVPPSNEKKLVKAILDLFGNPYKIINLGRNARNVVVSRYSSKNMAKRYCKLYDFLLCANYNRKGN